MAPRNHLAQGRRAGGINTSEANHLNLADGTPHLDEEAAFTPAARARSFKGQMEETTSHAHAFVGMDGRIHAAPPPPALAPEFNDGNPSDNHHGDGDHQQTVDEHAAGIRLAVAAAAAAAAAQSETEQRRQQEVHSGNHPQHHSFGLLEHGMVNEGDNDAADDLLDLDGHGGEQEQFEEHVNLASAAEPSQVVPETAETGGRSVPSRSDETTVKEPETVVTAADTTAQLAAHVHAYPPENEVAQLRFVDPEELSSQVIKLATKFGFSAAKSGLRRSTKRKRGEDAPAADQGGQVYFAHDSINISTNGIAIPHVSESPATGATEEYDTDKAFVKIVQWKCTPDTKLEPERLPGKDGAAPQIGPCRWQMRAHRTSKNEEFTVALTFANHNHPPSDAIKASATHRLQKDEKARIWHLYFQQAFPPRRIAEALCTDDRKFQTRQLEDFVYNWRATAPEDVVTSALERKAAARQKMKSLDAEACDRLLKEKVSELQDERGPLMEQALQAVSNVGRKKVMVTSSTGKQGKGRNYRRNALPIDPRYARKGKKSRTDTDTENLTEGKASAEVDQAHASDERTSTRSMTSNPEAQVSKQTPSQPQQSQPPSRAAKAAGSARPSRTRRKGGQQSQLEEEEQPQDQGGDTQDAANDAAVAAAAIESASSLSNDANQPEGIPAPPPPAPAPSSIDELGKDGDHADSMSAVASRARAIAEQAYREAYEKAMREAGISVGGAQPDISA